MKDKRNHAVCQYYFSVCRALALITLVVIMTFGIIDTSMVIKGITFALGVVSSVIIVLILAVLFSNKFAVWCIHTRVPILSKEAQSIYEQTKEELYNHNSDNIEK